MSNGRARILHALQNIPTPMPCWLMRQAGRYLPEYREVRAKNSFLELVHNPALCTEVALQPLRRYELDATIVFSDILVIHEAIGAGLSFSPGDGPKITRPVRSLQDADPLQWDHLTHRLDYVYQAVAQLRHAAPDHALFGFAGSPWTLLCYLVEGEGSSDFSKTRTLLWTNPALAHALLDRLAIAVADHLSAQLEAGADAVQIFDTWGGLLSAQDWETFAAPPLQKILTRLSRHPTLLFVRHGSHLLESMAKLPFTAFSLDHTTDLAHARSVLKRPTQGNLDNTRLLGSEDAILKGLQRTLSQVEHGHIFNLGHGVLPSTPPEAVGFLIRELRKRAR